MTNENKLENLVDSIWGKTADALDQAFRKASEFAREVDEKVAEQKESQNAKAAQKQRVKDAFEDLVKNFKTQTADAPPANENTGIFTNGPSHRAYGDTPYTPPTPPPAPRRDPFSKLSDLEENKKRIQQAIIDGEAIEFRYLKPGYYTPEFRTLDVSEFDTSAGLVKGTDPDDDDQFKSFTLTKIQGLVRIV